MSGTIWTKFFWSDWQADPALRLCSYAARGLWMDMLCIAASHDPIGYVSVAGRGLDETSIARMTGGLESEVRALLGELEQNGVFSRDRKGTIYSRRMVSDAKKSALARKNGKTGGNPSLSKDTEILSSDNPTDKPPIKPQEPLSNNQQPKPVSTKEALASLGAAGADMLDLVSSASSEKPDWWPKRDRYGRVLGDVTDKLLYQVGRAVLGKDAGGLITRLKQCPPYREDWRAAIDLMLRADDTADAKSWFMAALRKAELDDPVQPKHFVYPKETHP